MRSVPDWHRWEKRFQHAVWSGVEGLTLRFAATQSQALGHQSWPAEPDVQWISSREYPLVSSADNRQLCTKLSHDDLRLLDTTREVGYKEYRKKQPGGRCVWGVLPGRAAATGAYAGGPPRLRM